MALVFTPEVSGDGNNIVALASGWWLIAGTLTFSGSYTTGGEVLNLLKYLSSGGVIRRVVTGGSGRGLTFEYDKTNSKLKIFGVNPAAATLDVAPIEHPAAAYDADLTGSVIDVVFTVKIG